jgi:BMFP domain-containing protein YqiC
MSDAEEIDALKKRLAELEAKQAARETAADGNIKPLAMAGEVGTPIA